MKLLLTVVSLVMTMSAFAMETEILSVDAKVAGKGNLSSRINVNIKNNTTRVTLKVVKKHGGKNRFTTSKRFSADVPQFNLNGKTLEFITGNDVVDCGTMTKSRVFGIPTLKFSGHCELVEERVNGKVIVKVITN